MTFVLKTMQSKGFDKVYQKCCVQMAIYHEGKQDSEQAWFYYDQVRQSEVLEEVFELEAVGLWYFSIWNKLNLRIKASAPDQASSNKVRYKAIEFLVSALLKKAPELINEKDKEEKVDEEGGLDEEVDRLDSVLMKTDIKEKLIEPLVSLLSEAGEEAEKAGEEAETYEYESVVDKLKDLLERPEKTLAEKVQAYYKPQNQVELSQNESSNTQSTTRIDQLYQWFIHLFYRLLYGAKPKPTLDLLIEERMHSHQPLTSESIASVGKEAKLDQEEQKLVQDKDAIANQVRPG